MSIRIVEETAEQLADYETVPILFMVRSKYNVCTQSGTGGFLLVEEEVEPYLKDYDADENERPVNWPPQFDISNWGFFAAFNGEKRVGGAVVAFRTPSLGLLKGREDVASLWDIRVHPDHRGRGLGTMLFDASITWARCQGCHLFKIETQDINVAACRFYENRGCVLREVNRDAYPPEMNEIQLIWYLDL
ncbi:MAG: GNAT family N-acetyltransferase [Acidobacteriota bacterium]